MSNFDNSNWATLTLSKAVESEKNPQYSVSPKEITVIGRAPDCQIVLDAHEYVTVSRHHAEIKLVNANWEIKDLGTTNGTLVNGDSIKDSKILASGDRITLGLKGPEFSFECLLLNATVVVELTRIEPSTVEIPEQSTVSAVSSTPELAVISREEETMSDPSPIQNQEKSITPEAVLEIVASDKLINLEQSEAVINPTTSQLLPTPEAPTSGKNLWDLVSRTQLGELSGHESEISALAFSLDGQTLASAGADKTIKLWNITTQEQIFAFPIQKLAVNALAFSPDGQTLASAGADKTIKLWNITTQEQIFAFPVQKLAINALAFSPDGQTLASAGADKTIKLWNITTQTETASFIAHKLSIDALAFSPDGLTLASTGKDKTIKLWNIATQEEIASLIGHKQGITSLSFSLDGQTIASVGANESIKLWNFTTREEIIAIATSNWEATSVAIAANGQIVAVGDQQGKIQLYQI